MDRLTLDRSSGRAGTVLLCTGGPLTEEDRWVTKGGFHLCAPSYCHRYRPAVRQGHAIRSTTSQPRVPLLPTGVIQPRSSLARRAVGPKPR
jgi:hypothetical protein